MNLWQETDLHETPGLAPCAFLTIWNVRGKFLDMMMVQRSGDMLTASGAGGVNEIQYAALLMMIARHTGYEPGVFTHMVANEQIYDRHVGQANELLRRFEERKKEESAGTAGNGTAELPKQPALILKPDAKDFYSITIDEFEMKDYDPMTPQLKLELGI